MTHTSNQIITITGFNTRHHNHRLTRLSNRMSDSVTYFNSVNITAQTSRLLIHRTMLLFGSKLGHLSISFFNQYIRMLTNGNISVIGNRLPTLTLTITHLTNTTLTGTLRFTGINTQSLNRIFGILINRIPTITPVNYRRQIITYLKDNSSNILMVTLRSLMFRLMTKLYSRARRTNIRTTNRALIRTRILKNTIYHSSSLLIITSRLIRRLRGMIRTHTLTSSILSIVSSRRIRTIMHLRSKNITLLLTIRLNRRIIRVYLKIYVLSLSLK